MSTKIHAFDLIRTAGSLLSEDGEGYEYDRAIVELVHAMLDMDADADKDTTARLLRGAAGRDASIGLVEPSILTETERGTYYTGPLEPAKQAMLDEYGDSITVRCDNQTGAWVVAEHRGNDGPDSPNQWGSGATEEEAWRYFIGADYGLD